MVIKREQRGEKRPGRASCENVCASLIIVLYKSPPTPPHLSHTFRNGFSTYETFSPSNRPNLQWRLSSNACSPARRLKGDNQTRWDESRRFFSHHICCRTNKRKIVKGRSGLVISGSGRITIHPCCSDMSEASIGSWLLRSYMQWSECSERCKSIFRAPWWEKKRCPCRNIII